MACCSSPTRVNAADRQLFPLLAHDVRVQYGFSLSDTGLLTTIFTLGLAVAGLPTGYLLARFSRKTVLLLGIGIFSTGTALTVLAHGFPDMLVYLAATGIGEAMQLTVMIAIAANYFVGYRAAAIGSMNVFFGLGAFSGPILGGLLLTSYRNWHAPMIAFGIFGFLMIAVIALSVRPWFSETRRAADARTDLLGAPTLLNRNTIILTVLSVIGGLVLFGFTGMYPTYLREGLHYTPKAAGFVASFYGAGALLSIFGGWLGDRFSPRIVLSAAFFCIAALGYLCFHGSEAIVPRRHSDVRLRRDRQRHDLRQPGRLPRKSGAQQFVQPRLGHVRDKPLRRRRSGRLLDGRNRQPRRLGPGGRDSDFAAVGCRWKSGVDSAAGSNVPVSASGQVAGLKVAAY